MKNLILTLSFTCFLMIYSFAQGIQPGFKLSLKGGLTMANQYGEDADSETFLNGDDPENFYANHAASTHLKSGINLGGLVEYNFNKRISLGLGINYIQKGSEINATTHWNSETQNYDQVDGTIKWIQNYWTMDLPLKVYFPFKKHELHLLGGFTYGHLSHSEENGDIEISGVEYQYTNNRGANNNEPGFLAGAGFNYLLPNNIDYLTIEFIWSRSFGVSFGDDMIPNPQKYYNQTFSLNIGYKLDLKKDNDN